MGIFGKQSIRLLRKKWVNPMQLAREIFAILNSDDPIEITSPVTIDNSTTEPGITINQTGGNQTVIQTNAVPAPSTTNSEIKLPPVPNVGEYQITQYYYNGTGETWSGDNGTNDTGGPRPPNPRPGTGTPTNSGGGGGIPGKVVSGSGSTYIMEIYPDGLSGNAITVTATQLDIFATAVIPADRWTLVSKIGDVYYMQFPVWM